VSSVTDERRLAAELERRLEAHSSQPASPAAGQSDGLEDLALRVRVSLAPPPVRAAFKAAARWRLLHRLPHVPMQAPSRHRPAMGMLRRLAFATASVLLAFSLGTAGVAYAAQEAIPGDTLYGVKRGIETARYSLTENPQSQAALLSDLAAERMREIQALADDRRDALLAPTLSDYLETLDRLQAVGCTSVTSAQVLAQASARVQQHQQALERLLGQVPSQAVPAIERAIERTSHSHEVLEALQQGESPSDLAPGQDKEKERGPKRTPGPPDGKDKP
jgi:hypothetical protein